MKKILDEWAFNVSFTLKIFARDSIDSFHMFNYIFAHKILFYYSRVQHKVHVPDIWYKNLQTFALLDHEGKTRTDRIQPIQ